MSLREYQPFDADVEANGTYQYSTGARYSAVTANARLIDLAIETMDWTGLRVLDVGCGDGEYTIELYRRGNLRQITGIDLSSKAISAAIARAPNRDVNFQVCSGSDLPFERDSFDVVQFRGVLHHMDHPDLAIADALRVARRVLIVEPNGWNPGLKIIEKLSPYHREHNEQSFSSTRINHWVKSQGGRVVWKKWAGFVPFFCPTGLAKLMKALEPAVEWTPIVRQISCAVYAIVAERDDADLVIRKLAFDHAARQDAADTHGDVRESKAA